MKLGRDVGSPFLRKCDNLGTMCVTSVTFWRHAICSPAQTINYMTDIKIEMKAEKPFFCS